MCKRWKNAVSVITAICLLLTMSVWGAGEESRGEARVDLAAEDFDFETDGYTTLLYGEDFLGEFQPTQGQNEGINAFGEYFFSGSRRMNFGDASKSAAYVKMQMRLRTADVNETVLAVLDTQGGQTELFRFGRDGYAYHVSDNSRVRYLTDKKDARYENYEALELVCYLKTKEQNKENGLTYTAFLNGKQLDMGDCRAECAMDAELYGASVENTSVTAGRIYIDEVNLSTLARLRNISFDESFDTFHSATWSLSGAKRSEDGNVDTTSYTTVENIYDNDLQSNVLKFYRSSGALAEAKLTQTADAGILEANGKYSLGLKFKRELQDEQTTPVKIYKNKEPLIYIAGRNSSGKNNVYPGGDSSTHATEKFFIRQGEWTDFRFDFNGTQGTYSIYCGNEKKFTGKMNFDGTPPKITVELVRSAGNKAEQTIYVDDIQWMYSTDKIRTKTSACTGQVLYQAGEEEPAEESSVGIRACYDAAGRLESTERAAARDGAICFDYDCGVYPEEDIRFFTFESMRSLKPTTNAMTLQDFSYISDDALGKIKDGYLAFYTGAQFYESGGRVKAIADSKTPLKSETNEDVMIPSELLEEIFDAELAEDGTITVDGKTYALEKRAEYNGLMYLSLDEVAEKMGLYCGHNGLLTVVGRDDRAQKVTRSARRCEEIAVSLASRPLDTQSVTPEHWKELKDKWREYLISSDTVQDSGVADRITNIENQCTSAWNSMNKETKILALFGTKAVTASTDMTAQFEKLKSMVYGYKTQNCKYYSDSALKEDILFALDWLYENLYGEDERNGRGWRSTSDYNWWDWYIGSSTPLAESLLLMESELTSEDICKYLSLHDYLRTTMRTGKTADHAASRVYICTLTAALEEDAQRMAALREDYDIMLKGSEDGNGVREDWCYITHGGYPYTSVYGASSLADRMVVVIGILSDTKFELQSAYLYNAYLWMTEMFRPVLFGGDLSDSMTGRGKGTGGAHAAMVIRSMVDLVGVFDKGEDAVLKSIIKYAVTDRTKAALTMEMNMKELIKLNEILSDDSVSADECYLNKVFYTGDTVVHQRGSFGFSIAMSSERVPNYESINNANKTGWYQGDGMVYTYTANYPLYYTDGYNYWSYVNRYRMPGTTEDTQPRKALSITNTYAYRPPQDFVGAVELNRLYGTAAMQFQAFSNEDGEDFPNDSGYGGKQPYHKSSLMAKKAWFMFDDELVALGTDIHAEDGFEVNTYMENRLLRTEKEIGGKNCAGAETITVDGVEKSNVTEWTETVENPRYIHIENAGGFYLPSGGNVCLNRVNNRSGSGSRPFFEMWFSHGASPQNGSYAYVQLPEKPAAEVKAYSESPDIVIIENNNRLQAVRDKELNVTGIVFWQAGTCGNLTAEKPMIVMLEEKETGCSIAVTDPTQKMSEASVTLDGAYEPLTHDERIKTVYLENQTVLKIDFSGVGGRSLSAELKKTD